MDSLDYNNNLLKEILSIGKRQNNDSKAQPSSIPNNKDTNTNAQPSSKPNTDTNTNAQPSSKPNTYTNITPIPNATPNTDPNTANNIGNLKSVIKDLVIYTRLLIYFHILYRLVNLRRSNKD